MGDAPVALMRPSVRALTWVRLSQLPLLEAPPTLTLPAACENDEQVPSASGGGACLPGLWALGLSPH